MEILHIVTCVSNPLKWKSRINLARAAMADWLKSPDVHITLVECAYGSREFELLDIQSERVTHVGVRGTTMVWSKESLLNIGVSRLPESARKIAFLDADIKFRRPHWATEVLTTLDLFPVLQPWDTAYDLGPHDEHIQTHLSFCRLYVEGQPVIPNSAKFWKFNGGPYEYAHTGYGWAFTRTILDKIGGLFEYGGMGSGDHHQALALIGQAPYSIPIDTSKSYSDCVMAWQERALSALNKKIGYVHGTIEHMWHGPKVARGYQSRWDMFVKHQFNPYTDLKKNTHGVIEWAGNKPELEREWYNYLKNRIEDSNTIL